MSVERLESSDIKPNWPRPTSHMTTRYLSHPDLRLAFIQVADEPELVYVVSDEPLPETVGEAIAMVEKWRDKNGRAAT